MPITFFDPASPEDISKFLEAATIMAQTNNNPLLYGACLAAYSVAHPAMALAAKANQRDESLANLDRKRALAQVSAWAFELGYALHCMCPDCEAAREGREDPVCDCPDCRAANGEDVDDEYPDEE